MDLNLTTVQLLASAFALVIVLVIALSVIHDLRRKKGPPFIDYLRTEFDLKDSNRDPSTTLEEWGVNNRVRMEAYEAPSTVPPDGKWK